MERILKARKRGTKVVVIDHRRTETAARTDAQWIPIRPGTDGALALAMLNVIVTEKLYDERFVADWTTGFEDLQGYLRQYSPQNASEITGVPPEVTATLARELAQAGGQRFSATPAWNIRPARYRTSAPS